MARVVLPVENLSFERSPMRRYTGNVAVWGSGVISTCAGHKPTTSVCSVFRRARMSQKSRLPLFSFCATDNCPENPATWYLVYSCECRASYPKTPRRGRSALKLLISPGSDVARVNTLSCKQCSARGGSFRVPTAAVPFGPMGKPNRSTKP